MLKIYRAHDLHGEIIVDDYLEFKHGIYNTGIPFGFGEVKCSGSILNPSKKVNYDWTSTKRYAELTRKFAKIEDGFVTNFYLNNPYNYEEFEERFKDIPKTEKDYEKYQLNEEAILLFTDRIILTYKNDGLIERVFGRWPETGMYLIRPDATFTMTTSLSPKTEETYEVLQSKNLGKQLILAKLNRKIY